jgi:Gas vesicle protein G
VFILDSLLIGGLRLVLDKVATVVDAELNDESALREQLMAAQMRVELGDMSQQEFASLEAEILARLREIRARQQDSETITPASGDVKVTGVEATFEGDEH